MHQKGKSTNFAIHKVTQYIEGGNIWIASGFRLCTKKIKAKQGAGNQGENCWNCSGIPIFGFSRKFLKNCGFSFLNLKIRGKLVIAPIFL